MTAPIAQALLSVSDKTGLVEFARGLDAMGVKLISTGGTAKSLMDAGLPVTEVADYTGFPEMLDGRVKTLHPRVHGAILARRDSLEHMAALTKHAIPTIDLVVVNLYPFRQTVARPGCSLDDAIENIDIGGPALVRAAAKNHAHVGIVVDPADYPALLDELSANGRQLGSATRFRLARKAFSHTAAYDGAISNYLTARDETGAPQLFPDRLNWQGAKVQDLRYGENPHPIAQTPLEAYRQAFATDPTSAFGGIIAFNREIDAATIELVSAQFLEVLIAPGYSFDALECIAKKVNVRVLTVQGAGTEAGNAWDMKRVGGGMLLQTADRRGIDPGDLSVVSRKAPTPSQLADLLFVWRVAKFVKSNAIVYGGGGRTLGIGAGQMSRVDSTRIAAIKAQAAGLSLTGSVVASDAFFPFRDGLDVVADNGAVAIIQPGGSVRDAEVIAAADERGLAMVFTGVRHFRH